MSRKFVAEIEWEAVDGSRGRENRATWARLGILADGRPITRVLDNRSKGFRDHILVPLYPITEWIVTHWWSIFYEPVSPGRRDYARRHNLRYGREGYAFPDLHFRPLGHSVRLKWCPLDLAGTVSFPTSGTVTLDREQLQADLGEWIEQVIARLEQQGICDSVLQSEWAAIQATDEEERAFCLAAAQLGQDPYDISGSLARKIVQAAGALPEAWSDDFFSAVGIDHLQSQVDYVLASREVLRDQRRNLGDLVTLRRQAEKLDVRRSPWQQGYEVARWLRNETGAGLGPLSSDETLARALGLSDLPLVAPVTPQSGRWLDAIVEADDQGMGGFAATSRRSENRRFAFCRALFEYLTHMGAPSALVTVARTDRQKSNRAFAAELLAPAEWLRDRYTEELIVAEEVQDVSDELGVSSEVVYRQLRNHGIARLAD